MVNKGFEEKIHECCCRESCESFKVCCLIDKLYCQCSSSVLCEWLDSSLARRQVRVRGTNSRARV